MDERGDQIPSSADLMEAEAARAKAGTGCGHTCPGACHGGHTCLREPHDEDAPHVGRAPDGQLVQWIGPCDDDTHSAALVHAEQVKADNAQRTRDFLAGLDPDVLRDFLNGAAL